MVFNNIVVAFDGSENAMGALDKAIELTKLGKDVKLNIVNVTANHNAQLAASLNTAGFDPEMFQLSPEDIVSIHDKAVAHELGKVKEKVGGAIEGIEDQTDIAIIPGNDPAAQLLSYAHKVGADLVIMGSRGLGALRGVLGSVSYAVLRESDIPVLVIK